MSILKTKDRFRGCLLGLATGDALGTTLEFEWPGSFNPIDDMIGGGPFDLEPGQWTDDTSMALCLATSLIERGEYDVTDQMRRYVRWRDEGYLSSTGECFDIGNTIASALSRFSRDGDPYAGSSDSLSAGNGSLMRLRRCRCILRAMLPKRSAGARTVPGPPTEPKKRLTLAATSPA